MSEEIFVILKRLNATEGIKGSLLITPDGMPVSSALEGNQDGETLAAVSSSIYLSTSRSLGKLGMGEVTRYVLCTEFGKTFIVGLGKIILIVLAEQSSKAAIINVAIFQASNSIRKSGRLSV